VPAKSAACVKAGKPAIRKVSFDTQDAATNAVALGQADAFSADSPVTLYGLVKLKGKLQVAGKTFEAAPYGMAVAKGSGMAQAVQLRSSRWWMTVRTPRSSTSGELPTAG